MRRNSRLFVLLAFGAALTGCATPSGGAGSGLAKETSTDKREDADLSRVVAELHLANEAVTVYGFGSRGAIGSCSASVCPAGMAQFRIVTNHTSWRRPATAASHASSTSPARGRAGVAAEHG